MITDIKITYDSDKLAKAMPKMVRNYINGAIVSLGKGSKDAIKKGDFKPISDFTSFIRREGLSPNAGNKSTNSKKPLRHTGELFRSIKVLKREKSLEFYEYGIFHTGMERYLLGNATIEGTEKKSKTVRGLAYKVGDGSFSKKFGIQGKEVDIRNWLQFDDSIKTLKTDFFDLLDKNFKK